MFSNEGSCPICGASSARCRRDALLCTNCHSIASDVLPGDAEIARFYEAFNETYSGGGRLHGRPERLQRYARRYLSVVQDYRSNGSLIDVGSSTNPFPNLADHAGYQVTVADYIRPSKLDAHIEFIPAALDGTDTIFDNGRKFDVVTAFAVIEHCRYPGNAAKNLATLCAEEGVLILTTPLVGTSFERYAPGFTPWFYPPEHLNMISERGMRILFDSVGFDLIHFERFELNWVRMVARLAISAAEGITGLLVQGLHRATWTKMREQRRANGAEVGLYVFRRTALSKQ